MDIVGKGCAYNLVNGSSPHLRQTPVAKFDQASLDNDDAVVGSFHHVAIFFLAFTQRFFGLLALPPDFRLTEFPL